MRIVEGQIAPFLDISVSSSRIEVIRESISHFPEDIAYLPYGKTTNRITLSLARDPVLDRLFQPGISRTEVREVKPLDSLSVNSADIAIVRGISYRKSKFVGVHIGQRHHYLNDRL